MSHSEPERGNRGCPECGELEGHNANCPLVTHQQDEWTAESVEELIGLGDYHARKRLADAHNAALAAERKRYEKLLHDWNVLEEQLAAERSKPKGEKCPTCGYQLVILDNNELTQLTEKAAYHELRLQLAAERETVKNLRIEAQQYKREIERLKDMITDYANDRPR